MTWDRRSLLAGGAALPFAASALKPQGFSRPADIVPDASLPLWPDRHLAVPPGLAERVVQRSDDPMASDRMIEHVTRPRLDVFRPEKPNGAAMILAPGGGYRYVVVDKEGYELGRWLARRGVTTYVLFYRLPGDGWASRRDVPLIDAQRAMRLVRSRAQADRLDPGRIMFAGFSAGGHVATSLLTRFDATVHAPLDAVDSLPARPDATAAIYPVVSMRPPLAHAGSREKLLGEKPEASLEALYSPQLQVRADMPPVWLLHAADDDAVPVGNSVELAAAARRVGVACESHVFERGGHGFGLMRSEGLPVSIWPQLLWNWLESHAMV